MSEQVERAAGFESFFRVQHPRLVAIALGWCGDPDAARDVAQEALTRALRDWDRVGTLDVPAAWVRRVTINLLIDRKRRWTRDRALVERLGLPESVPAPELDDRRWWDAVRALPDRQRAAIVLHYLEELSIAEVADVLEIAPGTVKATLSQARDRLRRVLAEEEIR